MSWIAGLFEIIGGILIGNKNRLGFIFNFICCGVWIYIGVTNISNPDIGGILLVTIPMLFINVRNFIKWRKRNEN